MTPEQEHLFVEVAQFGISCGLEHPFEWYENYVRSLDMVLPYAEIEAEEQRTVAAFTAFYQGTDSGGGETVASWTQDDFLRAVDSFYSYHGGNE